jgi:hypothetical protein
MRKERGKREADSYERGLIAFGRDMVSVVDRLPERIASLAFNRVQTIVVT